MDISLTGYSLGTSIVVADVARVLDGVDVSTNTAATAPGCMSFPNDPECNTVLPKLGLAYGANPAVAQTLFTVNDGVHRRGVQARGARGHLVARRM